MESGVKVVGFALVYGSRFIYTIIRHMKTEVDDSNYESMISKLAKGSMEEKSQSLKKLLFLYENARARIYLYERRITECLELSLLIEQRDISLNALSLLEKIIVNTSAQSEIMSIIKRRLLSKMVLNLGSVEVTIRKISHKCILEYLRKFRDAETAITVYLKTAIQQTDNQHLKLKALNSLHSLLMAETKHFSHELDPAKPLLEELIHSAHQKEHADIRRAALICLIFILRVKGAENNLKNLSQPAENQLMQLRYENQELSLLLDSILKTARGGQIYDQLMEAQGEGDNDTPSPKFISIQETTELKKTESPIDLIIQKIPDMQLKIFNQVSFAQQFLKKLEKNSSWQFNEIEEFAPFLEKCLIDQSIKLFSISKKIVEVIFNSQDGRKKQYYVVLVPCIVNGIGNKRFIVKKNLDKLVRQYIKNHTDVWVKNFIDRFAATKNGKVKEILIDLMMHAYRTSPEFYYPTQRTFEVFDVEISDASSNLKRKVIDCILLILERQAKDDKSRDQMLQIFSADPYNKIMRKMGRTNNSLGSHSEEGEAQTLEPVSPIALKKERKQRLVTAEPQKMSHLEKSEEKDKNQNVSQEKYRNRQLIQYSRQRRVRNSQIEISFKIKKPDRKSKDSKEKTSLQRLPELKKVKNSSTSKYEANESPVKRSIGERNIVYTERQNLKPLQNPRGQLQRALLQIKDSNWSVQFDSINKLRSIIEFNKELVSDDTMSYIVSELLNCLNNLRSGVTKLALMCLNEIMRKFHKRTYPYSQAIILTIIKKSITTSEFMQDEIKKCIATSVEELCLAKMIVALNSVRESRSNDIKMTFLLFIEGMIKNERIYRKEFEWIWNVLTDFNEEPQFNLRNQCKRLVKLILESYRDWKTDVVELRKEELERIDKLLKNLSQKGDNNLWIEIQNHEFEKIVLNKIMTSKYFTANYNKFQELDKGYTLKKNWKDRIKLLNDIFQLAFQHPAEFEGNANIRKYFQIAIQQIDEKNPGLLINAVNNLQKSIDYFPATIEECLAPILQRTVGIFQTRRGELVAVASKMLNKLYSRYDVNKILKEYLKLLVGSGKAKGQILSQLIQLLRENQQRENQNRSIREIPPERNNTGVVGEGTINSNSQNILIKSLIKLSADREAAGRLKQLILICQRRFGQDFSSKLMTSPKILELMS